MNYEFGEIIMLSRDDMCDLELEIYKLNGAANLLAAWANDCEHFEASIISDTLSDTVKNINKIIYAFFK